MVTLFSMNGILFKVNIDPGVFEESERMVAPGEGKKVADIGEMRLEHGGLLANVRIAYQEWGPSDAEQTVWVCHAISGDSNAAAWWPRIIGPGKAINTDCMRVVCSNVLGGCQGSTGPSAINQDGQPYGSRFPRITIGDMVRAQAALFDHLGLERIDLVCGGSMGGMQALEWCSRFPDRVNAAWVTASALKHSPMQIGFNEVARQAIYADPKWRGGDYPSSDAPSAGLSVGRMLGHLTYLSAEAFEYKFSRDIQESVKNEARPEFLKPEVFQVESYLRHQGNKFTQRFDANTLIVVSQAIDDFELRTFGEYRGKLLVTSFTSDWIYPSHQSRAIHELALKQGIQSQWIEIEVAYGHDAFLLEDKHQAAAVQKLLSSLLEP